MVADDFSTHPDEADETIDPGNSGTGPVTPPQAADAATVMAPAAGSREQSGRQIGRYKLLEMIGEGGFGSVWMAEQREPVRRRVALKIIKLGMDTKQVIARFEAERQALAMMDHPNIAKVFDAGTTETGRPYFVMEYIKGIPILEYCDTEKLDTQQRLDLFVLVCHAIQHAHQKGIIHRDIKPTNVLITIHDGTPVPKVIDFGIAKATNTELTSKTLFTEHRQLIGTPAYMSPEQAEMSGLDIDTRSDIYSLGVLLYELLTGTTPFANDDLLSRGYVEMLRIIREEEPHKPSTRLSTLGETISRTAQQRRAEPARLRSTLKGDLDWIVMKCLEKDRTRRYETANGLAADLNRHLHDEPVVAGPPGTGYRISKFIRRNRGPVAASCLLALALIAGLVGTSLGFINAARSRDEAQAQRDIARNEKQRADERAEAALAAEARANRSAYSANMLSAGMALPDHPDNALAFLEKAPESLRGWEWGVLHNQLDSSIGTLSISANDLRTDDPRWADELIVHPDGKSFFSIREHAVDAVQRWDLATGELLARYERPGSSTPSDRNRAAFKLAPDGDRLYGWCRSEDGTSVDLSIWDLASNRQTLRTSVVPKEHADARVLAISPDGTRFVFGQNRDLWLQRIDDGQVQATAEPTANRTFAWYNDDASLLVTSNGRGRIQLLNGQTLELIAPLNGNLNLLNDVTFSRDGRWMGTAGIDSRSFIWDLQADPPTSTKIEHNGAVGSVRFSPDGSLMATECAGVNVWETATGDSVGSFRSDDRLGNTMLFMPDGQTVAVAETDGLLRFWNVTADLTRFLQGHQGLIRSAKFADQSGLIVSTGWDGWASHVPGCIRFWDIETGEQVAMLGISGEVGSSLAISPDGMHAAARITHNGDTTRGVLIDLATGQVIDMRPIANGYAFDPSSRLLAASFTEVLEIRDARDGSLVRSRTDGFEAWTMSAPSWSPDGRWLACRTSPASPEVGSAHTLLLDAQTLETVHRFDKGSVIFSPDGGRIIRHQPDGIMEIWEIDPLQIIDTVTVSGLAGTGPPSFSPDGRRFVVNGPGEGTVTVWNAETYDCVARFHEDGFVPDIAWNSTGTRLLICWGWTVVLFDDTPLRDRVLAREASRAAREMVSPLVERLLADLGGDPAKVLATLEADASLSAVQLKVARQEVLRHGLDAAQPATPSPSQ